MSRSTAAAHAAYMRHWRKSHPGYANKYVEAWIAANPDMNRAHKRAYYHRLRREVMAAYGGICKCCGENRYEFLAFDHVAGGGTKHRASLGNSNGFLTWLKRSGFPDSIRLLCHNCNQALGAYGRCPHEIEREQTA